MTEKFIAIIQTGTAIETARQKYGDFDNWFIKGMRINKNQTKTYRVFENIEFPDKKHLAGIIVTGSSAMVTDQANWSEATIKWLQPLVELNIPIMGVCYGHQLVARLLGGIVDWNPKGRELGQVKMNLYNQAYEDKLLTNALYKDTKHLNLLASHQQIVTKIPPNSVQLGKTDLDDNHCFRFKNHIWGLQFHPEFTADIVKNYIFERSSDLIEEGLDPIQMSKQIKSNNNGQLILQRFKEICF